MKSKEPYSHFDYKKKELDGKKIGNEIKLRFLDYLFLLSNFNCTATSNSNPIVYHR